MDTLLSPPQFYFHVFSLSSLPLTPAISGKVTASVPITMEFEDITDKATLKREREGGRVGRLQRLFVVPFFAAF